MVPHAYWGWSLVGAALTLAYAAGRHDPVFLLGALVTGGIFARNMYLDRHARAEPRASGPGTWPVAVGAVLFVGIVVLDAVSEPLLLQSASAIGWGVVGYVGQALWSGRFLAQWLVSERRGKSVLPESFFALGFVGSILLAGYALYRQDWVNVAAQAFNPIPYGRNWIILRRSRAREPGPSTS